MDKVIGGRGRLIRLAAAALAGALGAGIVIGLTARLLMSAITLAAAEESTFTLGGTAGVLLVFTVLSVPAALTANAPPVVRLAGRWVTAAVTGWAVASTGFADGAAVLLAPDGRMPLIAVVTVGFGATVVAHGQFAQFVARRVAGSPAPAPVPAAV
ncbi:hypothetical protein [Nonomuraea sp. NPDC048916]|uniref:hypothetical protein n=1 Tax=Nonomuraea sp. NPDC048916 TaxID=3154232 RepID=UPI0033CAC2FF